MNPKEKQISKHVQEMRRSVANACPWSITFAPLPGMDRYQKAELEQYMKEHFRIWADSWMIGPLAEIEAILGVKE